jgi:pimeloyl-ACP methyl ester carboxylesterase
MPVSRINGVNINWRTVGDHGPWVVMTTGGRRGYDEFIPLAEKIARYGFRVMLHDRRNTGASDILIEDTDGEEVLWTRYIHALMSEHNALPAFFSGSSSGARTSMLFCLRYPQAVRGLLLLRVTGGAFAAGRLPEQYYGQYIRTAERGGMAAICAMDQWRERIEANPANGDYLVRLPARQFIEVLTRWNEIFVAGGQYPVMGVSPDELRASRRRASSSPATTKRMRAPAGSPRTTSSQAVCCINCPSRTRTSR